MTAALIYLGCGLVCAVCLWLWFDCDYVAHDIIAVVAFSIVWPLVALCAFGFAAGVTLGWLEGLLP